MQVKIYIDAKEACLHGVDYRTCGSTWIDVDVTKLTQPQREELAQHVGVFPDITPFEIKDVAGGRAPIIYIATEKAVVELIDKCINMRARLAQLVLDEEENECAGPA